MHYLTLPGELRNEIYHALLNSSDDSYSSSNNSSARSKIQQRKQQQQQHHDASNPTSTLRLSKAGVLVAPSLAHTNNLIRRELCSLLEHRITAASTSAVVLEAQAVDFDITPLHSFLLAHHPANKQQQQHDHEQTPTPTSPSTPKPMTVKLTLHMTAPGAEKAHYNALRSFLQASQAAGWSVGYRVKFDWAQYGLREAATCARDLADAFVMEEAAGAAGAGAGSGAAGEGLLRALKKAREAEVRRCLVERPARQRALFMAEGRGRAVLLD